MKKMTLLVLCIAFGEEVASADPIPQTIRQEFSAVREPVLQTGRLLRRSATEYVEPGTGETVRPIHCTVEPRGLSADVERGFLVFRDGEGQEEATCELRSRRSIVERPMVDLRQTARASVRITGSRR